MKQKQKLKKQDQKGITLIALVVTIIVLIILATVSINIVINTGILNKADSANQIHKKAEELERLELVKGVVAIENGGKVTVDKYIEELIKEGITIQEEVEDNGDGSKQVITDNGYSVNIAPDSNNPNNIIITIDGKADKLPPRIVRLQVSTGVDNIRVEVEVKRAEGAEYRYYYKEAEGSYTLAHAEKNETSYTIENLKENVRYIIKVEVENENGTVYREAGGRTGVIPDAVGAITFGELEWEEGKASVTVSKTTGDDLEIQYKVGEEEYKTIATGGRIEGLRHGDAVIVRLWDGLKGGNTATLNIQDDKVPSATFELSAEKTDTDSSITAKVKQSDSQSGIDITKCRWEYNTSEEEIGTKENGYTKTFKSEIEQLTLKSEEEGTYYLHVLTVDKAGNKVETISKGIIVDEADSILPNPPEIAEGMTPVKWNGTNWIRTTESDPEWYSYTRQDKKWANVVLGDATFKEDGTIDESKPYSQLVWIPRYAYRITSMYHYSYYSGEAGTVKIQFIDTNNKDAKGKTYSTTYPEVTDSGTAQGKMDDYVVHPAFDFGDDKLTGFWAGKYESSHTGCTRNENTGALYPDDKNKDLTMMVKAGVTSWRNIAVSTAFDICRNMTTKVDSDGRSIYGFNLRDIQVDPHMMKNDEWGAVAYLSKSRYGKEKEEIRYNSSTIAGGSDSTTGNKYGIYDMSGGAGEYVAAYVDNNSKNLKYYGSSLIKAYENTNTRKYVNVYYSTINTEEKYPGADWEYTNPNNTKGQEQHYGDALWETTGERVWYGGTGKLFPSNSGESFFIRGGRYLYEPYTGIFSFTNYSGYYPGDGFRVVVSVI